MSALGCDPAPADPGAVRAVAAGLRQRGDTLRREADALASLPRSQWEGAAAASFTSLALTLPDDLRRAADAAAAVAAALQRYADALAAAQAVLPGLRRRAEDAQARVARSVLPPASPDPFGPPDPAVLRGERDREAAVAELAALRREAERLGHEVTDAGRVAARTVDEARELLPEPPPPLARAVDAVAEVTDATREDVTAFARDHAQLLQTTADVLAVAGLVATAASLLCPPLAVVAAGSRLAQLALVTASSAGTAGRSATLLGAAVNSALVAGTDRTAGELWPDALALGTLGASRVLTAPTPLLRGTPGRWNIATARAADARLPVTAGWTPPSTWTPVGRGASAGSVWAADAAIGPNELLLRSVRLAVDAPNAAVGLYGGAVAARRLSAGAAGGRSRQRHRREGSGGQPRREAAR